ncbi:SAM-dependent methyltransferase [Longimonas halophila]|uniref:SAM-dependent methyltransferase n=1 Tax=Longimonas halophila TaxID=1469170 RepID=A0A2H3NYC3_9BACT|nr:class I SAM-dependent methyltransferase [Longimonas halophila]PEN05565.1 SAM-dependent methyltransferase [Longimonas halophila]
MTCRHCHAPLTTPFLDLGHAPLSNAYLSEADLRAPESYYPLRTRVCTHCWLVQTEDYAAPDAMFDDDYAYFSSTSSTWLNHAARYAAMITDRLALTEDDFVLEVACNDGYLLRNFREAGIPCLGVEPTACTAEAARKQGIPVVSDFFGVELATELAATYPKADLIAANNVLAHVPDINDFCAGLRIALAPGGTVTLEFQHLMTLIQHGQFDTVYHEHFSYLSLYAVQHVLAAADLRVWDVERLPTHGGSLRVYACHANDPRSTTDAVAALLDEEMKRGLQEPDTYATFQGRADRIKDNLIRFLIEAKRSGKTVAAYGAAAKGNTLLNYAGIKPDLLPFVCDAAPSKQGKYLPGSHLPIRPPEALQQDPPDYVLILPWNIAPEIVKQQHDLAAQGTRFVVAVPALTILDTHTAPPSVTPSPLLQRHPVVAVDALFNRQRHEGAGDGIL